MKQFWKKTNRGLWLGGALLLITLAVIIVTSVLFAVEQPVIRKQVKEYVSALIALNYAPEGAELNETLSDADKKAKEAALETLFKTYWDTEDTGATYGVSVEEVREAFGILLSEALTTKILSGEVSISDRDISITADGPGYATVSLYVDTLSVTYEGESGGIFIGDYSDYYYMDEEIQAQDGEWIGTYILQLTLEMHRAEGEWRIISSYGYISQTHSARPDTAKGGDAK